MRKARGWYIRGMIRVLVSLSPRMYREAIVLTIHRNRPGLEVRSASPEDAERELATFLPHLLVHNDNAPIAEAALANVPSRVEVRYTASMDARVSADGQLERIADMDVGGRLRVVDLAAALAVGEVDTEQAPG